MGYDQAWESLRVAGGDDAWALMGDIAQMPLASVLQFLEMGRHTGTLVCWTAEDRPAEIRLQEGAVASAQHQHLIGPEAVLAMLERRSGHFGFSVAPFDPSPSPRFSASPLIMEAVRLEDELERFSAGYPGESTMLHLRDPHEIPTDPVGCGADVVMATLSARNGATVRQLLDSLRLAPIKIRVTAAWLGSTGRLRACPMTRVKTPPPFSAELRWFYELLRTFSGGLRVVVAVDPTSPGHDIITSIKHLAKSLDSGPAWISFGPDGTSMARVRPRGGGLLSIACVPMSESRESSFASLAATADLVLCESATEEQVTRWQLVASGTPLLAVPHGSGAELLDALRQFAASIAGTNAAKGAS